MKTKAVFAVNRLQRFSLGVSTYSSLLSAILGLFIFCGFSSLAQAPSSLAKEMLQPTYPEEFFLVAQPTNVWQALVEEIKLKANSRILVSEADDLVLSWVELPDPAMPTSPIKTDSVTPPPNRFNNNRRVASEPADPVPHLSPNDVVRLKQTEIAEVGNDGMALTTVMIIPAPKGAIIRFRRIYYGAHTQPRIANSTGIYERWMEGQLSKKLGLQP